MPESMQDRIFEEACLYGIESEFSETEGDMFRQILAAFRKNGMDDIADYWYGNLVVHGVLD